MALVFPLLLSFVISDETTFLSSVILIVSVMMPRMPTTALIKAELDTLLSPQSLSFRRAEIVASELMLNLSNLLENDETKFSTLKL